RDHRTFGDYGSPPRRASLAAGRSGLTRPALTGAPLDRTPPALRGSRLASPSHWSPTMRTTRVLVVDDEPLVASAARRLLARSHEVQVAHCGRSALLLIDTARFDAVLCDLMMPNMTGIELHARLSESRPELAERMVFLTGGVFDDEAERFLEAHA